MTNLIDQARRSLIRSISEREFLEGDLLPPSDSLAVRLGCSTTTVDRALVELARQGVVKRVRRKGTVVISGGEMAKRVGRVALVQSYDSHLNSLLTDPIYVKLHDCGFDVDVLPLSIESGLTARRLQALMLGDSKAEFLVMIEPPPHKGWAEMPHGDYGRIWPMVESYPWRVAFNIADPNDDPRTHTVTIDHVRSARLVAEHLIQLGHRRVAVEAGFAEFEESWTAEVARVACELLELGGIECHRLILGGQDTGGEETTFKRLLESGATAVWAVTDHGAMATINRLAVMGLRVPEQFSVIGRWDTPWCHLAQPKLTSVSLNPTGIADAIAATLVHMSETGTPPPGRRTLIKPSLVVRQSTAPPSGAAIKL